MTTEHDKLLKENKVKIKGESKKYHWGRKIKVQTFGWKKTDQPWISQIKSL